MSHIYLGKGGKFEKAIPASDAIFFYIVRGEVKVNDQNIQFRNLAEFENNGETIKVEATEDSILILGNATPFNEPMVAQGPFVMNTTKQIQEAYADYQTGKFGTWKY